MSMLISRFENTVDPDYLASEKPARQDLHCFSSACKYMLITGILQVFGLNMGEKGST